MSSGSRGLWLAAGLAAALAVQAALPERGGVTAEEEPTVPKRALVSEVLDGDTIVIEAGPRKQTVRLIGIDAPEERHPEAEPQYLAAEAQGMLAGMLLGRSVRLVGDDGAGKDRYGRLLAYVELETGADVGALLLERGLARSLDRYRHARRERYREIEAEARMEGRGIWAEGGLAELRWILGQGRDAIEVYSMTGGRFAVIVEGWGRAGLKGRAARRGERAALDDAIWQAHRALGAMRYDRARALEILQAAGFIPITVPAPTGRAPSDRPAAPPPMFRPAS